MNDMRAFKNFKTSEDRLTLAGNKITADGFKITAMFGKGWKSLT